MIRLRLVQLLVLALLAVGFPASARADEASCMALCAMQAAYCRAMNGSLVGTCWYEYNSDICNLNGCDLPQND